ncbi:MAG: heparinase II/III-family protein, partial [Pseudomonadota bacterium]
EELLEVFTLLNWAAAALQDAGRAPGDQHLKAIESVAPVLRALRHADGALARFHGGGRGPEGRLDRALATSGVRPAASGELAMGFARISHGRTSVVVDAAKPPTGAASGNAHASTLSFELTSGRRPVVVNCGSGATFGKSWRRAGRATPSHSTLGIDGLSSSRVSAAAPNGAGAELLTSTPRDVRFERSEVDGGTRVVTGHDGYDASHGLTHVRTLHLGYDGRSLRGEDALVALDRSAQKRFELAFDRSKLQGIAFTIRFHLHPDVDVTLDMNGTAVSMALKSGEIWVFRPQGEAHLMLESSVYLEKTRLSPRATKQVVLSGHAMEYSTRVIWSLAKAQETPDVVRDYATEDLMTAE